MPKAKRKPRKQEKDTQPIYLLRLSTYKATKGEHHKPRVRYSHPKRSNVYTRVSNVGDRIIVTKYFYLKSIDVLREKALKERNRFLKTKMEEIAGSMQVVHGRIKYRQRFRGIVSPGIQVSRAAKLFSVQRQRKHAKGEFNDKLNDALALLRQYDTEQLTYDPFASSRLTLSIRHRLDQLEGKQRTFKRRKQSAYAKAKGRA